MSEAPIDDPLAKIVISSGTTDAAGALLQDYEGLLRRELPGAVFIISPELQRVNQLFADWDEVLGSLVSEEEKLDAYRYYLMSEYGVVRGVMKPVTALPPDVSRFHQQLYVYGTSTEFNKRIVSTCTLASTINAILALGIEMGDTDDSERDILDFLSTNSDSDLGYRDGNMSTVAIPEIVTNFLRRSKYRKPVRAEAAVITPARVLLGLVNGETFVYGSGHARAIVGYSIVGKDDKVIEDGKIQRGEMLFHIVDPLDVRRIPNKYTVSEFVFGSLKKGLPGLNHAENIGARILRTDLSEVKTS